MTRSNLLLTRAVANGDADAVQALLAEGADVNGTAGGQTPLILSIVFRHTLILRLLLEAGANPQLRDSQGLNAIDWAERKAFSEGLKLLAKNHVAKYNTPVKIPTTEPTGLDLSASRRTEQQDLPTTKAKEEVTDSDEKARRWLAGIKRRFDEEAGYKPRQAEAASPPTTTATDNSTKEIPSTALKIGEVSTSTRPPEAAIARPRKPPEKITSDSVEPGAQIIAREPTAAVAIPAAASNAPIKPGEPKSTSSAWPKSSNRKRCPKCNAIYDGELVAYCAVDATPLIDANQPAVVSPPATAIPPLLWILVLFALTAGAAATYFIMDYVARVERESGAMTAPAAPVDDVKELAVVRGELEGKAVSLPVPEYPPAAKSEGVSGEILVRVKVNNKGRVVSVRSSGGDSRLRAAAIRAATKATFSAEKLNGRGASGTIVYTFKP